MKKSGFLIGCFLIISGFCYSQNDSIRTQFLELVEKVQNDKNLSGTFMYKGYKATIGEYKEYKTTIGKFIEIKWKEEGGKSLSAIYHNSLGYMTSRYFNLYKDTFKDFKVDNNKYCKDNYCYELRKDKKLPYIFLYFISDSEIREIK